MTILTQSFVVKLPKSVRALLETERGDLLLRSETESGVEEPLVQSVTIGELRDLYARAKRCNPRYSPPSLESYSCIHVDYEELSPRELEVLKRKLQLDALYRIEAYSLLPTRKNATDCDSPRNWVKADAMDGGGGAAGSLRLGLIEEGWKLTGGETHAGLHHFPVLESGSSKPLKGPHGVASLGLVSGLLEGEPLGVYPSPYEVVIAGIDRGQRCENVLDAICWTLARLSAGDVLLIELQRVETRSHRCLPVEMEHAVADAIRLATELGVTVIEPAGNGALRLNSQMKAGILRHPVLNDSGAIMVGAALEIDGAWRRDETTNYGFRVDCFAPGDRMLTLGHWPKNDPPLRVAPDAVTTCFADTSAAAAVVAGVTLSLQEKAKRRCQAPLHPRILRHLLRDPRNGIECAPGEEIGVMPQLDKLAGNLFG